MVVKGVGGVCVGVGGVLTCLSSNLKTSRALPRTGEEVREFMGNVVFISRKQKQRNNAAGNHLDRSLFTGKTSKRHKYVGDETLMFENATHSGFKSL